ncbi:hypothetical protein L1987_45984 [Smallanthus sonchifolius]|uniref:Uncharacterized protein n=1 Tax=Smallanthus sonchifolius TaxID=185202 RepID=A0ACB9FYH2_9ASTR|nr:hypothetical protein L1987_45984 [Smallanthus sonchifolius]
MGPIHDQSCRRHGLVHSQSCGRRDLFQGLDNLSYMILSNCKVHMGPVHGQSCRRRGFVHSQSCGRHGLFHGQIYGPGRGSLVQCIKEIEKEFKNHTSPPVSLLGQPELWETWYLPGQHSEMSETWFGPQPELWETWSLPRSDLWSSLKEHGKSLLICLASI